MYAYYAGAAVCFVFLPDVDRPVGVSTDTSPCEEMRADGQAEDSPEEQFMHSVWFTRGWSKFLAFMYHRAHIPVAIILSKEMEAFRKTDGE